jgi:hypothetical protein
MPEDGACAATTRGTTPAGAGFSIGTAPALAGGFERPWPCTAGETAISSMRSAQRRTESEMLAPQAGWSAKTIPAPTRIPRHLVQPGEVLP